MVLCGFITSFVIDMCVQLFISDDKITTVSSTVSTPDTTLPMPSSDKPLSLSARSRVLGGVLIGDFMHNFCDGIFMGTAFIHCSRSLAWSITVATIFHEIAQEFADYFVLTNPGQASGAPLLPARPTRTPLLPARS